MSVTRATITSFIVIGLLSVSRVVGTEEPRVRADRDPHTGQVVVSEAGRPVLQYNYLTVQPPAGYLESVQPGNRRYARARSDYIHPLYGPDGEILTEDWSKDHPHHRGIYWAWPEVDWCGQRGDLHALQTVIARPTANIKLQSGADTARIEAENLWLWEDETPIVREVTVILVHRVGAQGRLIDLVFHFEALADEVALARRGTDAYGGLNIRLSPIRDMQLVHHADPAHAKPCRAWSDSFGIRQGGTRSIGLAVFEKVTNPDYPGDYIEYPYLPWFQPTFPARGTHYVVKQSRPLTLQYRLWIRPDSATDEAAYVEQWEAFNDNSVSSAVLPIQGMPSMIAPSDVGKVSADFECIHPHAFPLEVSGDQGSIKNNRLWLYIFPGQNDWIEIPAICPDSSDVSHHPFQGQIDHFVQCLQDDVESHCNLEDAVKIHEVVFAAQQCYQRRYPVSLPLRSESR